MVQWSHSRVGRSFQAFQILKMRPLCCVEMSGTKYLVMQLLIPEEQIPHSRHCKNVKNMHGVLLVITINFCSGVKEEGR
jgi:hypothetical protein